MRKLLSSTAKSIVSLTSDIGNHHLYESNILNLKGEIDKLELAVERNHEYIRSYLNLELLYLHNGTSKQSAENKENLVQANKIKANNYRKMILLKSKLNNLEA